jgi:2-hydroxy-3-oxopropionate reductase
MSQANDQKIVATETDMIEQTQPHLGFVGIGKMGQRMARRLLEQGWQLTINDVDDTAVRTLADLGAHVAGTPAEVADRAEIVMTCLPGLDTIEEVVFGPRGLVHGRARRILIDFSTTGAVFARRLHAGLLQHDIGFVEAPVSGGIDGAAAGTLAVYVAGAEPSLAAARPILDVMGKVFVVGQQPGQAQILKLINNLLSTTSVAIACEGFVMGAKAGIDADLMLDAINAGTGRNVATERKFPKAILNRTFNYGGSLDIPYKDLSLCLEEAEELGVPMWIGNVVKQIFAYTYHHGGAGRDSTELIKTFEQWGGAEVIGSAGRTK